jgi:signal transduction histidine kinase/serine phosphatase RsbU (regulator of sigma subunit)/FixJ family two-component response regulator
VADGSASSGGTGAALPADLAAAVALGGEMGARFAALDWRSHPLGEPSGWPPEWRTTVAVALTSRIPVVIWFGPELFLVYNDAYIAILGEKHPDALGRPGEQVWWDIWESIGPMLGGVMTTGRATWSDDLMLPVVSAGRPVERYFTFTYGPIIAVDGSVDGVFCAVTETTEKVLGERRLQLLAAMAAELFQTRTVADAVDAVVRVCDGSHPDLPFVAVYMGGDERAARLTAATARVRGRLPEHLAALLPEPDAAGTGRPRILDLAEPVPHLAAAFDGNGPEQALLAPLAGAGTAGGHLLLGLSARRPFDMQYQGFCAVAADQVSAALTAAGSFEAERGRADALAQLDRAKTVFLTNVSHEFRTPLTLLLGPLEDAIAAEDDPAQRERLQTARRNAERLLRLVNGLLEFARTEAGRAEPKPVRLDVGALTAQIASSFTDLCRRAGLELRLDCRPATADVDVQMWETIVLNLLSNALKFTFEGRIEVAVRQGEDGSAEIGVTDTGTGIPAEDLPRLFERFFRAGTPRARSVEGSGIGLSLVRSLVELHGGAIEVDSALDVGTSVRITLPAARRAEPAAAPSIPESGVENAYVAEALQWLEPRTAPAPQQGGERDGRPLILIVDDNADMRRHLERICAPRWDVALAGDGGEALRLMLERPPDLVVSDVMMPTLDGLELVVAIRADPRLASTPVVMLSARAGVESAGVGLSAGADDYLPKPFSSADLVNRIAARLEAGVRERDRRALDQEQTRRAAALAEFATALSAATTIPQVAKALLGPPVGHGAVATCLGVLDGETGQIVSAYAGAFPIDLRKRHRQVAASAPVPIAEVIRSAQPMIIPEVRDLDPVYAEYVQDVEASVRAAVLYPLKDRVGSVVGAFALMWSAPRSFGAEELDVVERAALDVGRALERIAAAEREHRIAAMFQEHQLELDRRSGAAVLGAVYQPAAEMMRVGGDWYLAAPLSEQHRLAVSVGDAVGHGLPAATVMSRLRSVAAAATLTDPAPAFVLDLLERYADSVPGAACTTVAYAVVDSAAGTVEYVCAGHPYPLLVAEDGDTRYLTDGRRAPLTIGPAAPSSPGLDHLPPGALLLLYTDGLVERPGEDLDEGFARLAAAARDAAREPVDAVCSRLLEAMAPPGGYRDDVALLAVRPTGSTAASFVAAYPPDRAAAAGCRTELRDWLDGLGLGGRLAHDVLVAVSEAVGNAVEQGGHADSHQAVSVEVFADPDAVRASVTDPGRWPADSTSVRPASVQGRGLTLIHGLSDSVEIARSARGTRITMRFARDDLADGGLPEAVSPRR